MKAIVKIDGLEGFLAQHTKQAEIYTYRVRDANTNEPIALTLEQAAELATRFARVANDYLGLTNDEKLAKVNEILSMFMEGHISDVRAIQMINEVL